jgi:predicted nucleic acid-binding protein
MRAIFADAGYWIALFHPRDYLHAKALAAAQANQGRPIVTSQMVLAEFLGYHAALGQPFRQRAVQVVRSLQQHPGVEIVPQTAEQFEAALTLFSERQDKEWSVVDCASFLIMQERGMMEALAYDEHFRQAGFIPLLRDS